MIFFGDQSRFGAAPGSFRSGCTDRPLSRNDATCYPSVIDVGDGSTVTRDLMLELDGPVTMYFAVTAARASNGLWSVYSNEASKVFELEIDDQRPLGPPTIMSVEVEITCTTNTPGVSCTFRVE